MLFVRWSLILTAFALLWLAHTFLLEMTVKDNALEKQALRQIAKGDFAAAVDSAWKLQQSGEAHRARGAFLGGVAAYESGNHDGGRGLIGIAAKAGDEKARAWLLANDS